MKHMNKKEEYIIKSLEFLQDIIRRLNGNSFNIKLFAVTIFSVLITLYIEKENIIFVYVCIVSMLILALMDGMYLYNERKFREIYKKIIKNSKDSDLEVFLYNHGRFSINQYNKALKSFSILFIYICLIVPLLIIIIINVIKK